MITPQSPQCNAAQAADAGTSERLPHQNPKNHRGRRIHFPGPQGSAPGKVRVATMREGTPTLKGFDMLEFFGMVAEV